jgi:hypothetical protein
MSIPEKELALSSNEINRDSIGNGTELMQETHACFFSLLRDAFTKGKYQMNAADMNDAITQWQGNPISPLNAW